MGALGGAAITAGLQTIMGLLGLDQQKKQRELDAQNRAFEAKQKAVESGAAGKSGALKNLMDVFRQATTLPR